MVIDMSSTTINVQSIEELDLLRPVNAQDNRGFVSQYNGQLFFKPEFFNQAGDAGACLFSPSIQLHCIQSKVTKTIDELDLAIKRVSESWIPEVDKTELTTIFTDAKGTIKDVVAKHSYGFSTHNTGHVQMAEKVVAQSLASIKNLIKNSLQNKEEAIKEAVKAEEEKLAAELLQKALKSQYEQDHGSDNFYEVDLEKAYHKPIETSYDTEQPIDWVKIATKTSQNDVETEA